MADFYDSITPEQQAFIARQHMFTTATAAPTGRINCSPKGLDTFRVLSPNRVAYLDMFGSGNETCAHLQNDGRITIMMCSYDQKPNILRIYGRGRVVRPTDAEWEDLVTHFDQMRGQRQIVVIDVDSTQDSCGYAVPRYDFVEKRTTLNKFFDARSDEEFDERRRKQTQSIDGLPITP